MLWAVFGGLVVLIVAALLIPLLRARPATASRGDYDLAVYRDQLDEVERDVARGVLAPDLAEAARTEIKRRMLATAERPGKATGRPAGRGVAPAWRGAVVALVGVLVPAGSLGLYLLLGSPDLPDQPLASRSIGTATAARDDGEMERLTARLAAQMEQQPDRVEGWLLLGRSLRTLERYDEAARAFERALALTGRAPEVLSEYGEILVIARDGQVGEPARRVFEEVLRVAPAEPRARFYLGTAKAQQGDARGALQTWVDLVAVSPPSAPWLADVRRQIRSLAAAADIDIASVSPSPGLPAPTADGPVPPPAAAVGEGASGLDAADVEAAAQMSAEEREAMIRSMVEGLAARLEQEPDDAAGWRRLARAYQVLGEPDKAKDALARAKAAETKDSP